MKRSLLVLLIMVSINMSAVEAQENSSSKHIEDCRLNSETPIAAVLKQSELVNSKKWACIPHLWIKEVRPDYMSFINNPENAKNKVGYFDIKNSTILDWKEIPISIGREFVANRKLSRYNEIKILYIKEYDDVYMENKYILQGTNYFIATLVKEDNQWKIAGYGNAPTKKLISQGFSFGSEDEKTYDNRRFRYIN